MMIWILRLLALLHFGWGGVLLLAAGWIMSSALRILPHMSTGTLYTNLPASLLMGVAHAFPPTVLGVWMYILGRRLWSPGERLRTTLLRTHGALLILGSLAVYLGIQSVEAMERSTARGGGLLGPLAYVPLLFGIPVVVVAFCSLVVALTVLPRYQTRDVLSDAPSSPSAESSGKRLLLLLPLLILSAFVVVTGLRPFWPEAQRRELPKHTDTIPARTRSDIDALREISKKPPREAEAFFRSATMNGRLGVMMLADRDATRALVTSNLPVAFECIDTLEIEEKNAMAQIEKQRGLRTRDTENLENKQLVLLSNMNDLLSALRDIQHVPPELEPFLAYRATRKGVARPMAISLIGKLDTPGDKRSWLLFSYAAHGDEEAATAALRAPAHLGAQAEPVVEELKRLGEAYWKNPATAAFSWSVNQTVEEIEKKVKHDVSKAREETPR